MGNSVDDYDLNGNTLNDGTNTYAWDARNQLVSANSSMAAFGYDGFGRRIAKTLLSSSTGFLYDGVNPVQELNGATVTANLLTGGVDERFQRTDATGSYSYLTDALGSTEALTDTSGNSDAQYTYSPYGAMSISGSTTNSYDYTGRESDGIGLHYYRARYYNPATGRFLSEDPIGFLGGINLYAYAGDSPTNFADPSGMKIGVSGDYMDYSTAITYLEGSPIAAGIIQQLEDSSTIYMVYANDAGRGGDQIRPGQPTKADWLPHAGNC